MASFSPSSSPLIPLLLYTLLFAVPITSYPVDKICIKTKYPEYCMNQFGPYTNLNLQYLGLKVIETTHSSAGRAYNEIQTLLSHTSNPNLIPVYSLCSNYYSAAISALDASKEKVKSGQYGDLNGAANTVSRDVALCKQILSTVPKQPGPIEIDNDDPERLSNIFVAISGFLSGSG